MRSAPPSSATTRQTLCTPAVAVRSVMSSVLFMFALTSRSATAFSVGIASRQATTFRPSLSRVFSSATTTEGSTAETQPKPKKVRTQRVLSGVQPTGSLHLGNYLGAIRQWVEFQDSPPTEDKEGNEIKTENFFCDVDLHAITAPHNPKDLTESTKSSAALYLAAGTSMRPHCHSFALLFTVGNLLECFTLVVSVSSMLCSMTLHERLVR